MAGRVESGFSFVWNCLRNCRMRSKRSGYIRVESSDDCGAEIPSGGDIPPAPVESSKCRRWPPTERERNEIVNGIFENFLTCPPVLSLWFPNLPKDTAYEAAKRIEEESFIATDSPSSASPDDAAEIFQVYDEEIFDRSLFVKFRMWPPMDAARDVMINYMIEKLSSPSHVTEGYGVLSLDEASEAAKHIEEEFFAVASSVDSRDDVNTLKNIYVEGMARAMVRTVESIFAPAATALLDNK